MIRLLPHKTIHEQWNCDTRASKTMEPLLSQSNIILTLMETAVVVVALLLIYNTIMLTFSLSCLFNSVDHFLPFSWMPWLYRRLCCSIFALVAFAIDMEDENSTSPARKILRNTSTGDFVIEASVVRAFYCIKYVHMLSRHWIWKPQLTGTSTCSPLKNKIKNVQQQSIIRSSIIRSVFCLCYAEPDKSC